MCKPKIIKYLHISKETTLGTKSIRMSFYPQGAQNNYEGMNRVNCTPEIAERIAIRFLEREFSGEGVGNDSLSK